LLIAGARGFADLPGGHSEGYDDTFKQVFRRFYKSIEDPGAAPEYPQFADGLRQMRILDAELASNREHRWVEI
jgi:predicted dehydrogenase